MSIEERENTSFPSQLLKSNKVSKSEGTREVEHAYHFKLCADAVYKKISKLVNACRNYSLRKLARFFETQCRNAGFKIIL